MGGETEVDEVRLPNDVMVGVEVIKERGAGDVSALDRLDFNQVQGVLEGLSQVVASALAKTRRTEPQPSWASTSRWRRASSPASWSRPVAAPRSRSASTGSALPAEILRRDQLSPQTKKSSLSHRRRIGGWPPDRVARATPSRTTSSAAWSRSWWAVIGIPHHKSGESVHAVVVLADGETATADELIEWCRGRLAGYKRPRSIEIIEDTLMPRTATGKILHHVLRDRYSGSGPTGVGSASTELDPFSSATQGPVAL